MTPPIPPPLPNQIAEKLWYYTDSANQPVGPVPYSELLRLADAKVIRPVDYVREKGTSEWVQFDSVCPPSVPPPLAKGEGETPVGSPRNLTSRVASESLIRRWLRNPLARGTPALITAIGLLLIGFIGLCVFVGFIASLETSSSSHATTLGMTPQQFRVAFNEKAIESKVGEPYRIREIALEDGPVKNSLKVKCSAISLGLWAE